MLNVNKDFYIKLFLIVLIFGQKMKIIDVDAQQADTVIVLSLSPGLSFFFKTKVPPDLCGAESLRFNVNL